MNLQDYESRLEALQKQVEGYFPEAPEAAGAGGSVSWCMFSETMSSFLQAWLRRVEPEGPAPGFMGLSEVELLPVHVCSSAPVGERHLPDGGQRSECRAAEEGDGVADFRSFALTQPEALCCPRWRFGSCC